MGAKEVCSYLTHGSHSLVNGKKSFFYKKKAIWCGFRNNVALK